MNGNSHILLRTDSKKKRARFRRACNLQGVNMTTAFNLLMEEVIRGKIKFTQGTEKVG